MLKESALSDGFIKRSIITTENTPTNKIFVLEPFKVISSGAAVCFIFNLKVEVFLVTSQSSPKSLDFYVLSTWKIC